VSQIICAIYPPALSPPTSISAGLNPNLGSSDSLVGDVPRVSYSSVLLAPTLGVCLAASLSSLFGFGAQQPNSSTALVEDSAKPHRSTFNQDNRDTHSGSGQGLHLDVELALVNVTVTDPYGHVITGLDPEDFRVYEDNIEQEVLTFSSEDAPISIGVVFDFSGSMADKVGRAREAALEFFKTANPQDEFFLVSFNERAELACAFTSSIEDLQSSLMLTAPKGRTALLDAIYLGLRQMTSARHAKRALLILSDGGDNHSRYTQNDVKRLVKEADTEIYAIGLFEPLDYRSRTPEELYGPSLLSEVTEMTGGRVFAVENMKELPDIAAKIGLELRNQYVLGYRPSNKAHDARWRKIKVKLHPPKGLPPLRAYSKTGYYAANH
jgi:Ca-activated chloride channel homolog